MISVVTVVKDDLYGFMRTRRSLEDQTFKDWEHVVVPASGEDSTNFFVGQLPKGQTKLHEQVGHGIYSAMNQGLAHATREFVVFLNAGDLFAGPETLDMVSSYLNTAASQWFIFGGHVKTIEGTIDVHPVPEPDLWLVGCGKANVMHPSVYYRRLFLVELGGYDESFRIAGDLELNMRIVSQTKPVVVDLPASIFFADGVSSNHPFVSISESLRARSALLERGPSTSLASLAFFVYQALRATAAKLRRRAAGNRSFPAR